MTKAQIPELKLIERAYQFVNESLRNAENSVANGEHHWIFAISNIAQGLELLLKERLRREHSLLIYADIDRGRSNTVTFTQALQRLSRCGVQIEESDLRNINRARELRNSLVHFAPPVNEQQLRAAYVDFLEFAHVFHLGQFEQELHPYIEEPLWTAEATLMGEFGRPFVEFQGATVSNYWPSELLEAQFWPFVDVDGTEYERVPYGKEEGWEGRKPTNCHDCAALPGQFHGPGCDVERCPKCRLQFISCDCDATWTAEPDPESSIVANQDEEDQPDTVATDNISERQYRRPPRLTDATFEELQEQDHERFGHYRAYRTGKSN